MRLLLSIALSVTTACVAATSGSQQPVTSDQRPATSRPERVSPDWTYTVSISDASADPQSVQLAMKITRAKICTPPIGATVFRQQPHPCYEQAVAATHVSLVNRAGDVLVEADTDAQGVASVPVDARQLVDWSKNGPMARIDGKAVELPDLDPVLAKGRTLESAADEKAMQARSLDETKNGKCFDNRIAALQQALSVFKTIIESDKFILDAQSIAVATPTGASMSVDTPLGGEYHVIVAGYSKVSVDATNPQGQPVTLASPYARIPAANKWYAASKILQGNHGDRFKLSVKGNGCFLMMSFKHY